jgi:hypothetical protein
LGLIKNLQLYAHVTSTHLKNIENSTDDLNFF